MKMNKLLKYLAERDLQNDVKAMQDAVQDPDAIWIREKSESFTAKFKEELACIIDAGIHLKFYKHATDTLSVSFHYDYNGSTFIAGYISDDIWTPDYKAYGFSDFPNHYLLDAVGNWYKSLLPAPVKKDPVILIISFPENVYKGHAAQSFRVECPFSKGEISSLQMQMFKNRILDSYGLIGANLAADFDFDIGGH